MAEGSNNYISLQEATQYCNYSQEYLSLRARQGKLKAVKLGRNWVTKKEWLDDYFKKVEEYNSLQEATQYCDYSQEYLSLRARQGELKAVKFGRNWVTKKEWLDNYLQKIEEYNNNFKIKEVKKFVSPPANLPVEEISTFQTFVEQKLKSPVLRLGFATALVFVLLVAGGVLGKESFQTVYRDLSPHVVEISQTGDLITDPIGDFVVTQAKEISLDISNRIENTSQNFSILLAAVGNQEILIGDQSITVRQVTVEILSIFKEYCQWISNQTFVIGEKIKESPVGRDYLVVNNFLEEKLTQDIQVLKKGYFAVNDFIEEKLSTIGVTVSEDYFAVNDFVEEKLTDVGRRVSHITQGMIGGITKGYLAANDFVEQTLFNIKKGISSLAKKSFQIFTSPFKAIYHFVTRPLGISLTKEELMEIEEKETKKIIEEIQKLKEEGVPIKEIIKEVTRITKVEPVKEITKETIKIDEESIKKLETLQVQVETQTGQISSLQKEMARRPTGLIAPSTVIQPVSQQPYSPRLYVKHGQITLETAGSGNIIFTAADNIIANSQNFIIGGNLIVSGTQTYTGAVSITASSTLPAFTITQEGSGDLVSFVDGLNGIERFNINSAGTITLTGGVIIEGSATTTGSMYATTYYSTSTDSTVRKTGEEVLRGSVSIFRYGIPSQTGTTTFFRISKYFSSTSTNPLSSLPDTLPGATRVYRLVINYADDIATSVSSTWQIYRPNAAATTSTFYLPGVDASILEEGKPYITELVTIPADNDWQVELRLPDETKTIRIFQIFLAAYDQIN